MRKQKNSLLHIVCTWRRPFAVASAVAAVAAGCKRQVAAREGFSVSAADASDVAVARAKSEGVG